MKAIYLPRERVITETSTDYQVVVLEAVNDLYDKEGDKPSLRRNPNLTAQLEVVRKWGVPILFRVVVNAQWYSDGVQQGLSDKTSWRYWMDKWLLDDVSNVLQNPARAHGFLVTAVPVESTALTTTPTWVRATMQYAGDFIFEKWGLPVWFEFTSLMMNTVWDKAGGPYGQMQAFLETKEWVDRGQKSPMLDSKVLVMPENTLSYISFKPAEPEVNPEAPENPEVPGSVPVNADILKQLDAIVIYLDSIQKLLESYAPWRR